MRGSKLLQQSSQWSATPKQSLRSLKTGTRVLWVPSGSTLLPPREQSGGGSQVRLKARACGDPAAASASACRPAGPGSRSRPRRASGVTPPTSRLGPSPSLPFREPPFSTTAAASLGPPRLPSQMIPPRGCRRLLLPPELEPPPRPVA